MSEKIYGVLLASFSVHSHQRSFVPLYRNHPRIRIVAVTDEADIEPELKALNQEAADELGVPYVEGFDRALEMDGVDIVSIAHEIERRADLAQRAAAAGKHLWIDKFIGATIEECDDVVAAVEAAGVKSIVAAYVYGELVGRSKAIIASGDLGELLGLHADVMFSKGWPRPIAKEDRKADFLPPGRWKFPDLKRELLAVGAYAVGLVQTCLGPISHVHGQADAYFFSEHAATGTDDFGTLTMTDDGGRIATICGGRIGVATHPQGGPSRAYLIGSETSAVVDGKAPQIGTFLRQEIVESEYRPTPDDPMQWAGGPPLLSSNLLSDQTGLEVGLEDFVAALDEDRMPAYTVRQARDHMEILIAGYLSIVRGETVALPLERGVD